MLCPKCRHNVFTRVLRENIKIIDTGEGLLDETTDFGGNWCEPEIFCNNCDTELTDEELIRCDDAEKMEAKVDLRRKYGTE